MRLFSCFLLLVATALGGKLNNAVNDNDTYGFDTTNWSDIYGATDAPVFFPTTAESATASTPLVPATTTSRPLVTTNPITAPPSPQGEGPSCSCNWTTTWLDIIILIDGSAASKKTGLDTMWEAAGTVLSWLNVVKTGDTVTTNYTSRVGIVIYGNDATVYRPLGSVNSDDLDGLFELPYNNEPATNLEAGLQAAGDQLGGSAHRSNAKKVIMLFASSFNPAGQHAPQQSADAFKVNGGILIVYNYIATDGQPADSTLSGIASPGYFFSSSDPNFQITDLNNALCDANCFCDLNYASYTQSYRNTPSAGCYQSANAPANYARSVARCSLFNSFLAADESYNKTLFLGQQLEVKPNNFWIGLTWDLTSYRWEWSNGTPLGSYQPWVGGSTPTGSSSSGCVYVNYNNQWVPTDCRNGFVYVCEAPPCDSMHYCP